MIRHCVFVRFTPHTSPASRAGLFDEIAALTDRLPGLLAVHRGSHVSPATGMDKGYAGGVDGILLFDPDLDVA